LFIRTASVGSIPFNEDYVSAPVCGAFYLQCLPNVGCCIPPPECKALDLLISVPNTTTPPVAAQTMDRDKQADQPKDRELQEDPTDHEEQEENEGGH
jgi:hypothetical protein